LTAYVGAVRSSYWRNGFQQQRQQTQAAAAAVTNACLIILFLIFEEEGLNQGMDGRCGFDVFGL